MAVTEKYVIFGDATDEQVVVTCEMFPDKEQDRAWLSVFQAGTDAEDSVQDEVAIPFGFATWLVSRVGEEAW